MPDDPVGRAGTVAAAGLGRHFSEMIGDALAHARAAKDAGRAVVGILCEYTPREIIMAAGAVPVCLCGGSAKMVPPAEDDLPAGLCPLIKSTYGYHVTRSNPFLEMADLVVAETTCDGKKKMYELMGRTREMVVLELPQNPTAPDALPRWQAQFERLARELERRLGLTIDEAALRAAIRLMNRERRLKRELAGLMRADAPPLTGRQVLDAKSIISGIPADLDAIEAAIEALQGARDDAHRQRARVLLTGVPVVHGAERVVDLIESHGGLVVAQENCTGLKPVLEDVDEGQEPMRALARKYLHLPCSVMSPNAGRTESLRELVREYRVECIIDLVWHGCLTYDVESHFVRKLAEEELGVGYLKLQTDYSPSDAARLATRIEALCETVMARRGGAA